MEWWVLALAFPSPKLFYFGFIKQWDKLILHSVLINAGFFAAFDQALEFRKNRTVPGNWKTELKEESSSSEAEEEEEDEKEKEDNSSEEEVS